MAGGAYVVIALFFALAGGLVGRLKGHSFWLWFLIAGAVPIFGLLAAVFARDERTVERMRCPGCATVVPIHQAICTRCGTELELPGDPQEILPPERA